MGRGKRILGILFIIISIAALISWEKWGRSRFIYEDIEVLSKSVSKGTVITREMLETSKVEHGQKGMLGISDASWLIGKEAGQYVREKMPLFKEYFQKSGLSVSESKNRYMLNIPEAWIDSCSASISRGDTACFYTRGRMITSMSVSAVNKEDKSIEVIATDEQVKAMSKIAASGNKFVISYD